MSTTPKNENVETLIYVLKDPETKVIRYVGKTVHTLQRRLSQHLYDSRTKEKRNHRLNWIKKIVDKGQLPIIEEIDKCKWNESQEREQYWIKFYRESNIDLINETDGGEGNLNYHKSKETIEKCKQSQRKKLPQIHQYSLDGTFIKSWNCIPEAAEALHIESAGIRRNAIGERNKYKNFIWSFNFKDKVESYKREKTEYKACSRKHSELSRLIKQEDLNLSAENILIYNSNIFNKDTLVYEAISITDAANFLINKLSWKQTISTLKNAICQHIISHTPYHEFYFSKTKPYLDYNIKSGKLLHLEAYDSNTNELLFEYSGLSDFCNIYGLNKTNVINNLKGKTKSLIFGDTKLKINYKELPTFQVIEKSVQDKNGEG